jgi:hypothetical protein
MTQQQELLILFKLLRRRMDQERRAYTRALMRATRSAIGKDRPMDALTLVQIQQAREAVSDEWYGRFPGDESGRFYRLMVEQSRLAYRMAAARERATVLAQVEGFPSLVDLVTREPA